MFSFKEYKNTRGNRPLIMGILNITPDSFSDGGEAVTAEAALKKTLNLVEDGADIIDIGACSTAPGNTIVSEEEELFRLKKILPLIMNSIDIPISVDTLRPRVAIFALENGARIINDESGVFSREMAELVKEKGAGWIFMHTGGITSDENRTYTQGVVADVRNFFFKMKGLADVYGIDKEQLCYDVGIGFGKSRKDDLALLKSADDFEGFSPLLYGVSRKRVIGEAIEEVIPEKRIAGSVGAAAILAFSGVDIIRTHDVKDTLDAVKVAFSIKKGDFYGKDNY